MVNEKKNGKKFALFITIGLFIASIVVLFVITAFYKLYDPSEFGRINGGIDKENVGIPQEAEEQRDKVGTP
ncbi:hypothetical protein LG296_19820 (plasmid) [Ureibacillus chungkukjangi]|uniref:hypothetical protein n=1 Tax=Ureibacillus chungkukjangi TaxID=1202712 RepID=UPI000D34DC82|nr:hypothetical protein [Ureibacillus chungkukjangi]MCM3390657.1 hypothetical protein [Ureibacillus chungkukjangi]HCG4535971.1 hypothetical protein [Salmonella enterica subsp. enterica serovar Typhi str. AG3]